MKKAIELIRVSTQGQADDDKAGIPAQRASNRRTAAAAGLEIVRTIELTDVSGTAVLRSPEIQELLRLIESPDIEGVVAREFSRLMRPERFEDFILLQAFADTKTVLYLPEGPIDLSTKAGSFMGGMRALMAGWERREILERMHGAQEEMRRAGKFASGQLPFGVAYENNRWSYTGEAEKIREAFRLVLTTSLPYAGIARRLNLGRTNLRCMLSNPIYSGWRVVDQKRDPSPAGYVPRPNGRQGYRKKIRRTPEEVIRIRVMDGIVSESDFAAVQEILSSRANREQAIRTKNQPRYMFNGFLRCAACGMPMYSHKNQTAEYYYCKLNGTRERQKDPAGGCRTPYVMAKKIEPKIDEMFSVRLQHESTLAGIAEHFAKQSKNRVAGQAHDPEAVKQQIELLKAKRTRILDSFYDGIIDRQQRDERLASVSSDIEAYKGLQSRLPANKPALDVDGLVDLLSVFAEMAYLPREDKRSLLRAAHAEVSVHGYTIKSLSLRALPISTHTDSRFPMAASVAIPPQALIIPINW